MAAGWSAGFMAGPKFSRIASSSSLSSSGQGERLSLAAFVTDAATEAVLRDGLSNLVPEGMDIRRGSVRNAIAFMGKALTPKVVIIDISGQENPLQALSELCDVIEPSARLVVIGDTDNVELYRRIVRDAGAADYIFKPLTSEMIGRQLAPIITFRPVEGNVSRGGRVIAVTGARGGVGATTVAASLAWRLGVHANKHTILVDADINSEAISEILGLENDQNLAAPPGKEAAPADDTSGQPTRIVDGRFHFLNSEALLEKENSSFFNDLKPRIDSIRLKYNFVVMDIPYLPTSSHRELLELAHHQVIVFDASLVGLRDALRLLSLTAKPKNFSRPILILNRSDRPGGLSRKQLEEGLKRKIDFTIPDLPRHFSHSRNAQSFAKLQRSAFGRTIGDVVLELGFDSESGRTGISPVQGGFRSLVAQMMRKRPAAAAQ